MRFFRFFGDYEKGAADLAALTAIEREIEGLKTLSRERIRAEFLKILSVRRAAETIALLDNFGILNLILDMRSHPSRFAKAIDLIPSLPPIARLAALLDHDCDLNGLRGRLRLSNDELRQLVAITDAMRQFENRPSPLGPDILRTASFHNGKYATLAALAIYSAERSHELNPDQLAAIDTAPQTSPFTGELMLSLGVSPGPEMGRLIQCAEQLWIDAKMPTDEKIIREYAQRALMVNDK